MSSRRLFTLCFILLAALYALGYFVLKPNDGPGDSPDDRVPTLDLNIGGILPPNTSILAESPELSKLLMSLAGHPAGKSLHLDDAQAFLETFAAMPDSEEARSWTANLRSIEPGRAFLAAVPTIAPDQSDWIGGFRTAVDRTQMEVVIRPLMRLFEVTRVGRGDLINHRGWVVKTYLARDSSPSWVCNRGWFLFSTNKELLLSTIDHALGDSPGLSLDQDPYVRKLISHFPVRAEFTCFARGPFPDWTGWPNGELAWSITNGADQIYIQGGNPVPEGAGKPPGASSAPRPAAAPGPGGIPIHPQSIPEDSSVVYGAARAGHALFARVLGLPAQNPEGAQLELQSRVEEATHDSFAVLSLKTASPPGEPSISPLRSLHFVLPVRDPEKLPKLIATLEIQLDAIPIPLSTEESMTLFPAPPASRRESFPHPAPAGFGILIHPQAVALTTDHASLLPHLGQFSTGLAAGRGDLGYLQGEPAAAPPPAGHREFLTRLFGPTGTQMLLAPPPNLSGSGPVDLPANLAFQKVLIGSPGSLRYFARHSEDGGLVAATQGQTPLSQFALAVLIDKLLTGQRTKISEVWSEETVKSQ